jgi:hypothetical protein
MLRRKCAKALKLQYTPSEWNCGLPGTLAFTYPVLLALDAVGSKSVAK